MGISFSADEIFEMAEEIERNGAGFYREAAKNTSDKEIKQMLLELADMEDEHLTTFQQMRSKLSQEGGGEAALDLDNQAVLYLHTMADARGTEGKKSPMEKLTGNESIKEILDAAINAEKDSVVFYYGLRELVPARADRNQVRAIILEELSHITTLLQKLKALN
jgi:rubrerythrin